MPVGITITSYNVVISFDIWFVPADCGDPSLPMNGFVMAYDSTLEGSQIVLQCNPGFVPSQQMMSVCAANGNWNPDPAELVCRGTQLYHTHDCPGYSVVVSGFVNYTTEMCLIIVYYAFAISPIQLTAECPSLSMDM